MPRTPNGILFESERVRRRETYDIDQEGGHHRRIRSTVAPVLDECDGGKNSLLGCSPLFAGIRTEWDSGGQLAFDLEQPRPTPSEDRQASWLRAVGKLALDLGGQPTCFRIAVREAPHSRNARIK